MRAVADSIVRGCRRLFAGGVVAAAALVPAATAGPAPSRLGILYAGDWNGPMQIFAADPSGRAPVGQVTFDRPEAAPCFSPAACGYTKPQPSPDGRRLAYWSTGAEWQSRTLWLANADGTGARALGPALAADWAPDSRRLAYSAKGGIHVRTVGGADRVIHSRTPTKLRWSPDGKAIAFIDGRGIVVLRGGHERLLLAAAPGKGPTTFAWAPDGREIAYGLRDALHAVSTASGEVRTLTTLASTYYLSRLELAYSPDERSLAFTTGPDIRMLDLRTSRVHTLPASGRGLAWSPDGKSLLYVTGSESSNGDGIVTGDLKTVTPSGHVRVVARAARPYGGQIVAAAWTTPPRGLRYRTPQRVDGVFAGGPVQEIAADGDRVAFLSCGGVSAWTPATGAVVDVAHPGTECRATFSRGHVYGLGLAGDRLAWVEKGWGLCFLWDAWEATLGTAPVKYRHGNGCLGSAPPAGVGTARGAGSLLVASSWTSHYSEGRQVVDEQRVERLEPDASSTVISTTPGPYTLLDVDGGRILVSGLNETRVLDRDGRILLSLPVPTTAGQLSGSQIVLAAGGELRVYDAATGALQSTWPLPAQPVGQDCDYYADPRCTAPPRLALGDTARGLATYVLDGQVHLLRLSDGADRVVAPGTLARFATAGLVFADGARVRLVPFDRLPLT